MNTKLNKKDVQLLLRNKEIRKALLEDLLYFQKKTYQEDNHLDELIKRLEKENIRDSPIEYDRIKDEINELENKLLSRYPDIKEEYERKVIFKQKKQKNEKKQLQISEYSQRLFENMSYTQYELERKAGTNESLIKNKAIPLQKKEFKNDLDTKDDNTMFLQQLEKLSKIKRVKKLNVNLETYTGLLKILKTFDNNIGEKNLFKTLTTIENGLFQIKDPIINSSLEKALKIVKK